MKLSTRMRYGTRALTELALAWPDKNLSTKDMADRQDISFKYLEQIMTPLRAAGLINSTRGRHGGFALARPPEDIKLIEVYEVLEGSAAPVECVDHPEQCPMEDICPSHDTWAKMRDALQEILEQTTLQDLAEKKKEKAGNRSSMYYI